ncbi:MAG: chromate transporter [Dysgonamonadaceae bacterium]|jgi:chromate transporter|nr:chromate transporter [Dysgonamonadaceae bacterium]
MKQYWEIFVAFAKIGTFTIGGGYAMIPLIEKEVVDRKKWISRSDFVDMIAVSQSAPGILAVNISILTGYKLKKNKGSVVASLGSTLPSFLIILLIALFFRQFEHIEWIQKMFKAIRPAVVALIAVPVFTTAKAIGINIKTVVIPVIAALLIWFWGISPVYIILAAAIGGLIYGYFHRKYQ